uniref:Reverse transcriptase domain-containing protein n=1 Tax=Tanacetum cinerariifolium TaxID=118510 RepID=A0A699IHD7_TANCI|nr:reverse transcriptase domain-containing protein [Tanacetum cinerariifolium]
MADTRTMEELLQAPTEGYGDAIVIPAILADNFELKHGILNLVTSKRFCVLDREDPHAHIRGNLLTKTPREALTLIESKSKVRTSRNRLVVAKVSTNTSTSGLSPNVAALTDVVKALLHKNTTPPLVSVKVVEESCVTCDGPPFYYQCLATDGNASHGYQDNIQLYVSAAVVNYNQGNTGYRPPSVANQVRPPGFPPVQNNQNREIIIKIIRLTINNMKTELRNEFQTTMLQQNNRLENMLSNYFQANKPSGSGTLPSNTITNPKGDLKQSPHVVGFPTMDLRFLLRFLPLPRWWKKNPSLHFNLRFSDALLYMPKFASTFKNLLSNKEKLFELVNTPINDNCSAVILKKLPEKLGDPGKFLIPCNFPEIVECLALVDLGASINLIHLSIWKKLSLPELTPTQMILELANPSTTRPTGIAEDVFVKVGKFYFPADFVVVDYVVDPRVPLILGRPFLRTARALIDVHGKELTLRVSDVAITFKVGNTLRYSYNDAESINRIDVIDVACEEYSQEVLGFSDNSKSGNPTPISEPIIANSSPSLTPFEGGDLILEEIESYLVSDSVPSGIDDAEFDPEGDIRLIKEILNNDPTSPLPPKDLKCEELKSVESSVNEPPELKIKDLPSHLEYAFLEGTDKLPVIIAKNLKDDEKERIIKVLKSQKQAIAWKISDIKGIDPKFCTHRIKLDRSCVVLGMKRF